MFLVADGGTAFADDLHAYELGSIWERSEDRPIKVQEPAESLKRWGPWQGILWLHSRGP